MGEGGKEEGWRVDRRGCGIHAWIVYIITLLWHRTNQSSFMGIKDRFLYLTYTVHLSSIC